MSTSHPGTEALVLLIWHLCGLVHDDREIWQAGWLSKKAYRDATGIDATTCRLAHSFPLSDYPPEIPSGVALVVEVPVVYSPGLWWFYRYEA